MFVKCNKFLGRKVSQVHSDLPSVEYFANFFATKIKNVIITLPCTASSFSEIVFNEPYIFDIIFNSFANSIFPLLLNPFKK